MYLNLTHQKPWRWYIAVFIAACIAVVLAYPMANEEDIEIQKGYPVVYNQDLNKWEPQAIMQQKCEKGKMLATTGNIIMSYVYSNNYW